MQAVHVTRHGGPEVLETVTVDDPTPGPGEVLVRVGGVGVNFIDTYLRSGYYPSNPPYVPGSEGAGTVVAVGDGVAEPAVGTRVAWCDAPGSYAELAVVPAHRTVVVPEGVEDAVAASVLLQGVPRTTCSTGCRTREAATTPADPTPSCSTPAPAVSASS